MTRANAKHKSIVMGVLSLALIALSFQIVTAQQPPRERDILRPLKQALSNAGAPDLTMEQESQLQALVSAFRENRPPQDPNNTLRTARRAYEDAILAGDLAAAQAQAGIIADQLAASTRARLQAQAEFKIQVLNILTEAQKSALQVRFGSAGISRILSALAGGGRPGGRGDGPGPGAGGPRRSPGR